MTRKYRVFSAPWCPVNGSMCAAQCNLRSQCEANPDKMRELLRRTDPGLAEALGRYVK